MIRLGVGCCTVVQNLIRKMNEILATRCHCITSALVELKRRIDFWVLKLEESKQNHCLCLKNRSSDPKKCCTLGQMRVNAVILDKIRKKTTD